MALLKSKTSVHQKKHYQESEKASYRIEKAICNNMPGKDLYFRYNSLRKKWKNEQSTWTGVSQKHIPNHQI